MNINKEDKDTINKNNKSIPTFHEVSTKLDLEQVKKDQEEIHRKWQEYLKKTYGDK